MPHFRPNLSNPFNHFPQSHAGHQQPHYGHQNTNYQSQHFGGHPSFSSAQQNGHMNGIVNPSLANGSLGGGFGGGNPGAAGGVGLASQEAQMRFAHGAALQQQQQQAQEAGASRSAGTSGRIRDVYANNLAQELDMIRRMVEKYPYVSMVGHIVPNEWARIDRSLRTQSFLAWSHGQWETLQQNPIITIRQYARM